jgi:hypothetical protein
VVAWRVYYLAEPMAEAKVVELVANLVLCQVDEKVYLMVGKMGSLE